MKNIAVIGCGWLGLPVAQKLVAQNYTVYGTTTTPEKLDSLQSLGITPQLVDLNNEGTDLSFLSKVDTVFISFPPRLRAGNDNYLPQLHFLRTQLQKYTISKVVFISSTSVYPSEGVFDENTAYTTNSEKQDVLLSAENIFSGNFPTTVIRMGGLFGGNRKPHNFIKNASQLETDVETNLIHQTDAVDLSTTALKSDFSGIINGVHPHHPSKFEFYEQCYHLEEKDFHFPRPTKTSTRIINSQNTNEIGFSFKKGTLIDYLK